MQVQSEAADDFTPVSSLLFSGLSEAFSQHDATGLTPQVAAACVRGCVQLLATIVSLKPSDTESDCGLAASLTGQIRETLDTVIRAKLASAAGIEAGGDLPPFTVDVASQDGDEPSSGCDGSSCSEVNIPRLVACAPVGITAGQSSQLMLCVDVPAQRSIQKEAISGSPLSTGPRQSAVEATGVQVATGSGQSVQSPATRTYRAIAYSSSGGVLADVSGSLPADGGAFKIR